MGAHQVQARTRGSSGEHVRPSRSDFKIYWEVRTGSGGYVTDFPGDTYYSGLTYGRTVGIHSRTVQATVQSDMESVLWTTRTVTGGNGGVSGTSLSITANGIRVQTGCRITGAGIPADTFVVSYTGGATGTLVMSAAAAVANGTTLSIWTGYGNTGVICGNGGGSGASLTVTAGGTNIHIGNNFQGYGIPFGTKAVSYTGGVSGTLTVDQTVSVPDGTDCVSSLGTEHAKLFFADWEGGGESASDMQNILTWMRGATGYSSSPLPVGYDSPPIGIYGNNQCAMNRALSEPRLWTPAALATHSASNDTMEGALTGTGNATCDAILPEVYCYGRADEATAHIRWMSAERERMGVSVPLYPMLNPAYPPGRTFTGSRVPGGYWRAMLETAIHDTTISGIYIWHADRSADWDASEEWFVETLDFISTYGITSVE